MSINLRIRIISNGGKILVDLIKSMKLEYICLCFWSSKLFWPWLTNLWKAYFLNCLKLLKLFATMINLYVCAAFLIRKVFVKSVSHGRQYTTWWFAKNLVRKKSYACTSIEDLFGVNYILMHEWVGIVKLMLYWFG